MLLKKIDGNVFVHKLCTICLIKTGFMVEQTYFVKRMMSQAVKDGRISQESYAKKHSHCDYAVLLTKLFYGDSSQVLHHPAGLGECNFGDCYDGAAHPCLTSIMLQSFGPTQAWDKDVGHPHQASWH